MLTLVSLMPRKWPRSLSVKLDTPLAILMLSVADGESARGSCIGETGCLGEELWETPERLLACEVREVTEGEKARPFLFEAPFEASRGTNPVS